MTRRRLSGLLLFAAALVACSASPLAAQTVSPGGDERPTVEAGPFALRPRLVVHSVGVDNNVFHEAENPKSDFTFGLQPDLEVTTKPGPVKIVWTVGSDFLWYQTYKSERMANRFTGLNVDVTLKRFRPFFSANVADTSERPSPEIDARARRVPRTYAAGATVKLGDRTSIGFKAADGRERYEENQQFRGEDLAKVLNHDSATLEGSFGLELSPLTTFSVIVGHDELVFEQEPLRNSTSMRVLPTLTFNPAGIINGSASFGYKHFDGEDPSMPEYSGFAMNGSVSVLLGQRFRVESRFTRDVQYSYEEALPYYVLTGARGTLATQLTGLLDFRLTAGHDRMSYRAYDGADSPGTDRQRLFGGGVGIRIGDRKRIVIQAEFLERNSSRGHLREFEKHRIFGSLSWGA